MTTSRAAWCVLLAVAIAGATNAATAAELYGIALKADGALSVGTHTKLKPLGSATEPLPARTDTDGRFHYADLRPGRYELTCGDGEPLSLILEAGRNVVECRTD